MQGDRIGKPYVECGIDRIDCIVESDILDHVRDLTAPDAASIKIAENLVEFLEYEQKMGRLPEKMLPLQSGVGSIANAVLLGLAKSRFGKSGNVFRDFTGFCIPSDQAGQDR